MLWHAFAYCRPLVADLLLIVWSFNMNNPTITIVTTIMLDSIVCYEMVLDDLQRAVDINTTCAGHCDTNAVQTMLKLASFFDACTAPMANYRRMLQTPNTIVNQAKQQDAVDKCAKQILDICIAYGLEVADTAQSQSTTNSEKNNNSHTTMGICSSCLAPFTVEPSCPNCGLQLISAASRYHTEVVDSAIDSTAGTDPSTDLSATTRSNRSIIKQRRSHFRAFLMQYQGKGTRTIPDKVITHIRNRLHATHLVTTDSVDVYEKISRTHINAILRSTKHSAFHKYYKDVGRIHTIITGQKPPDLSHIETRLTLMFDIGFVFLLC